MLNKEKFDYSGITRFHDLGYTGKGLRIAIIDARDNLDETLPFFHGKAHDVFKYLNDPYHVNEGVFNVMTMKHSSHLENTVDVVHQIVPESEIFCFSTRHWGIDYIFEWILANNIQLINFSLMGLDISKNKYIDQITEKCFICASSGNDGKYVENYPASNDKVLAVGACSIENDKVYRCVYSTISNKLDIVNFAGLEVNVATNFVNYYNGTSCSSPYTVGMLALFMEKFEQINNRFPTITETNDYIFANCKDLETEGPDINTGKGIFILNENIEPTLEIKPNTNFGVSTDGSPTVKMYMPDGRECMVHTSTLDVMLGMGYKLPEGVTIEEVKAHK